MPSYTPQEIAEINARYPGMEWINGQPFTRVQVPSSEVAGYDAQGNPIDYLGNPVEMTEQLVPAHTTEGGIPWWFLAAQAGGPAAAEGIGALFSGGAAAGGAGAGGSTAAGSTALSAPVLGTSSLVPAGASVGLSAPAVGGGAALGGGAAAAGGVGGVGAGGTAAASGGGLGGFLNSPVGQLLVGSGLGALGGLLTPDDENTPFKFSEVEGEKGRLVSPENSLYNLTRSLMGLQLGLSRALETGYSPQTPLPGRTSTINVPGLPFSLGGVGQNLPPIQGPRLNATTGDGRNHMSGFLEDLLRPPTPPDLTPVRPQPGQPTSMTPNSNTAQPRGVRRRRL